MDSKLFVILSLITFLLEVSLAKPENAIINFLEISMLNEATEDQKILFFKNSFDHADHGLRTPNEGINQRYLKNWADVADKICFSHT